MPVDTGAGPPQFRGVVPIAAMRGDDDDDTARLRPMFEQASSYLRSFAWCREIKEAYFGLGVGDIVAVFLFGIERAKEGAYEWLWVVVGDLPPACLLTGEAKHPAAALDGYVFEMERWVEAVTSGSSVDGLIPVNAPPSLEYADLLKRRLVFLHRYVLSTYAEDDLKG